MPLDGSTGHRIRIKLRFAVLCCNLNVRPRIGSNGSMEMNTELEVSCKETVVV
jgi:hypothetical protein